MFLLFFVAGFLINFHVNCFGIDYPISAEQLAQLINNVIGREVSDIKLWDWDDVVRETLEVYYRGK